MKTDREKAKSLVQYWLSNHENHDKKCIELGGFFEQAFLESRFEGMKEQIEKDADIAEKLAILADYEMVGAKIAKAIRSQKVGE